MSITELSIKRPMAITVVFVVLILFGAISYTSLSYELIPKFDVGVVAVNTVYPGASPEIIETSVTKPIEDAVSTIEGLDVITSSSSQNVSSVIVQLKSGYDDQTAQLDIERKINQIKSTLPTDVHDPVINRISTTNFPVISMSLSANMKDVDMYELVKNDIVPELSNVDGVGQISVIGGVERQISVNIDNNKLNAYQIPISQIYQALNAASVSYPAGKVTSNQRELTINLNADLTTANMIRNIIIRQNANGSKVYMKDVASVSDATAPQTTINRINGKNGIGLQIYKTNDANAVEVSKGVEKKLKEIEANYKADDLKYEIANDQSVFTLTAAHSVVDDILLAVLIVSFVMLLFLHSFRSSTFVLVAIPSALIPTFIMLKIFGFSLNMMTLTALSLVVGILVDDSIVILENIFRHMEMGKDKERAAIEGRSEIGFTAIAITMVDLVVFIPMALTTGLVGNIIRQFALTVVFSTIMSLFVSFTLTPMLAAKFGKITPLTKNNFWGRLNLGFENLIDKVKVFYGKMLGHVLHHKKIFLSVVVLLMIASVALVPAGFIGSSFMDTGDNGQISFKIEMAQDMPLYQTNLAIKKAEELIMKHKEVTTVYSMVGTKLGMVTTTSNNNLGQINVSLVDKRDRKIKVEEFGQEIRNELESKIPGIKVTSLPSNITGSSSSPIMIVVKGSSLDVVKKSAEVVKNIVKNTPGTDYVNYFTSSDRKQIRILPDRTKISNLGFTVQDVSQFVNLAFNGNDKTQLKDGDNEYDIELQESDLDRQNISDVKNLMVISRTGKAVRLGDLADVEEVTRPTVLQRTDRMPSMTITASNVGVSSGTILNEVQKKLDETKFPPSVSVEYMGMSKNQKDAFSSLGLALILAIVLMYFVMVALYESLLYPFVVLFSVPVATIGVFLILALTMNNLTIFTISGMIMLMGLVAKNGILIVDFVNHLKAKGVPLMQALVEAGQERLRPIVMTTFAMILGMLPLALSQSPGSETKNGMAWVIIGGLTSSLIFTLFLVPSMYMIMDKIKMKFWKKK